MPEYSGIYLVENCVAERKRGKIMNLLYKSTSDGIRGDLERSGR